MFTISVKLIIHPRCHRGGHRGHDCTVTFAGGVPDSVACDLRESEFINMKAHVTWSRKPWDFNYVPPLPTVSWIGF
jgi:hypothetical protein